MNRNDKNHALSSGKFLNYGKSAGVKVLTNIMSVRTEILNNEQLKTAVYI